MNRNMMYLNAFTVLIALVFSAGPVLAQSSFDRFQGQAREAWITGKVETVLTLNRQLNPFAIDTDVSGATVTLSGNVSSEVDRALAAELVLGVQGVDAVDNQLTVTGEPGLLQRGADQVRESGQNLMQWVDDATATATVKTRLLANSETEGLNIDVDTDSEVITLRGEVATESERMLAEEIARNSVSNRELDNQLVVTSK